MCKEQIIIYYKKDKKHSNDYIVKRVLTQEEDEYYSVKSYYMINDKIKEFPSKFKYHSGLINTYLLQCKKSVFFDRIEYQNIMEGI